MNEQVREYMGKYPDAIAEMFQTLRQMIFESVPCEPEEKLWARLPTYYVGDAFVRLIPFKDHINIEAAAASLYQMELTGYKMTPKGMVQLYLDQPLPRDVLKRIFAETLRNTN